MTLTWRTEEGTCLPSGPSGLLASAAIVALAGLTTAPTAAAARPGSEK